MQNLVIHYSEIGTKGQNRSFFENTLMDNLRGALKDEAKRVYKRYGRILCELEETQDEGDKVTKLSNKFESEQSSSGPRRQKSSWETKLKEIKKTLELFPGISSFAFAEKTELDINKIKEQALKLIKNEEFTEFAVETKRSNKQFPLTSPEVNKQVAEHIIKNLNKKVNYRNPDIKIHIEIGEKEAFVYQNKHQGIGGLPIGTGGKLICLLSGGIDSPVASYLLMKRGCKIVFVHIHNQGQTSKAVQTKLEDLVEQLTKIQLNSKLYVVPFEKIQKQIIMNVPSKLRMVVYRRFMMRIINQIARKEKAKGVITGDSIGQVASQTIENINCIYQASELPVFAPLIGMNKEEIVNLAKKIETYELSIVPYPDCCSFMIAQHPETKGKLVEIEQSEKQIENQTELIEESVKNAEKKSF